jgi:hypothetical protein
VSTERQWARVVFAAQNPFAIAERNTVVRDAMELGLQLEPAILGCSVTELTGAAHRTPVWSGRLALDMDAAQYAADAGPCLSAARSGTVQHVAGAAAQARYPGFAAAAQRHDVQSSLSVPLTGSPRPAALNFYSAAVTAFDAARSRAAADLLARCLVPVLGGEALEDGVLENNVLEDGLAASMFSAALARRVQVRRAQDTLIAQPQVRRHEALSMLMQRSRQEVRSIHDVAEDLCGTGPEATS